MNFGSKFAQRKTNKTEKEEKVKLTESIGFMFY